MWLWRRGPFRGPRRFIFALPIPYMPIHSRPPRSPTAAPLRSFPLTSGPVLYCLSDQVRSIPVASIPLLPLQSSPVPSAPLRASTAHPFRHIPLLSWPLLSALLIHRHTKALAHLLSTYRVHAFDQSASSSPRIHMCRCCERDDLSLRRLSFIHHGASCCTVTLASSPAWPAHGFYRRGWTAREQPVTCAHQTVDLIVDVSVVTLPVAKSAGDGDSIGHRPRE